MIVVKEGYVGRLIGKSGERINGIESDTKMKVRVMELKPDFKDIIRAVYPLP
ncbi:MAG: KH domain-containing protein [Sulfolobaceae archaeon]